MTTAAQPVEVTTWYLQYEGPAINAINWPEGVQLVEAEIASPELSQFMFRAVGGRWQWFSRLGWSYQQWLDYFNLAAGAYLVVVGKRHAGRLHRAVKAA